MPAAQNSAKDYEYVVDQRSKGRKKKEPGREQDRRYHTADIKENLRRQQNAREVYAQIDLILRKSLHKPAYKLWRKNLGPNRPHNHHGGHHRDNDGECFLRVRV